MPNPAVGVHVHPGAIRIQIFGPVDVPMDITVRVRSLQVTIAPLVPTIEIVFREFTNKLKFRI
jgi:hypothetical protein